MQKIFKKLDKMNKKMVQLESAKKQFTYDMAFNPEISEMTLQADYGSSISSHNPNISIQY